MTDTSAWAVFITNKITQGYCKGFDLDKLSESKFRSPTDLTRNAPIAFLQKLLGITSFLLESLVLAILLPKFLTLNKRFMP